MAVEVTSRVNMGGAWYGIYGIKRGEVFTVETKYEAEKLVAQGLADIGRVSADKLGKGYEENPEALQRFLVDAAAQVPEEHRNYGGATNVGRDGRMVFPGNGGLTY